LQAVIVLFGAGIETVLLTGKAPLGVVSIRRLADRTQKQIFGFALIGAARQKYCQADDNDICQNGVSCVFSHRAYLQQLLLV